MDKYVGYIDTKLEKDFIQGYFLQKDNHLPLKAILQIDEDEYIIKCDIHNDCMNDDFESGNHGYKFTIPNKYKDGKPHNIKLMRKSTRDVYAESIKIFKTTTYESDIHNSQRKILQKDDNMLLKNIANDISVSETKKPLEGNAISIDNDVKRSSNTVNKKTTNEIITHSVTNNDVTSKHGNIQDTPLNTQKKDSSIKQQSKKIKVSVIIPVYNSEKYLKQCIDSVINQSLKEIEIICVDDGSTDSSLSILSNYSKDKRVKIIKQNNMFAGYARNAGINISKGEFIHFLDSDDWIDLDTYEKLYDLAKRVNCDFIKFKSYTYDSFTQKCVHSPYTELSSIPNQYFNRVLNFLTDYNILIKCSDAPWSGIYNTKFIKDNNILFDNLQCVNDSSFFFKCLIKSRKIFISDKKYVYYRRNNSNSLIGNKAKHFDCQIKCYNIINTLIKNHIDDICLSVKRATINNVFHWYQKLNLTTNDSEHRNILNREMQYFCKTISQNELQNNFKNIFNTLNMDIDYINPDISIVMPVFNAEKFINVAFNSLCKQTFTNFEVICVNDGSSDNSFLTIQKKSNEDNRFIAVDSKENCGAGASRNKAIKLSRGKYIVFLDADDELRTDALEKIFKKYKEFDSDLILTLVSHNNVQCRSSLDTKNIPNKPFFSKFDIQDYIFNITSGGVGGKAVKKDFLVKNDILFPTMKRSEDIFFVYKSLIFANNISIIDEPLYNVITVANEHSLEKGKTETPLIFLDAIDITRKMLIDKGLYEDFKKSFINANISRVLYNIKSLKSQLNNDDKQLDEIFNNDIKNKIANDLELTKHERSYYFAEGYEKLVNFVSK